MKKNKILTVLVILLIFCTLFLCLTACDEKDKGKLQGTEISSIFYEIDGDDLSTTVDSSQNNLDFSQTINVAEGATYKLYRDESCLDLVLGYDLSLENGNNIYYLVVSNDNFADKVYKISIYKRSSYRVYFISYADATFNYSVEIEENKKVEEPTEEPSRIGATFTGWDFDFSTPITSESFIYAKWDFDEALENFDFTSTNTECSINGLKDKSVTEIYIPSYVTDVAENLLEKANLVEKIIVDNNNAYYKTIDGNLYTKDGKILVRYATGKKDEAFTVPLSVEKIVVSDGVKNIGKQAFENCLNLQTIVIADSVVNMGFAVFEFTEYKENFIIYLEYEEDNLPSGWNSNIFGGYAEVYYYSEDEPENIFLNKYWRYVDGVPTIWME